MTPDIPEDIRAAVAQAICEASGQEWRTGTYPLATGKNFEWEDHDADKLNNHWRYKADAALKAIEPFIASERTRATEAEMERCARIAEDTVREINRDGFVLGGPAFIGRSIAASIRTEGTAKCEAAKVRYAPAIGTTLSEMRASVPAELYNLGDAKLVWANEGDLAIAASIRTEGTKP